MSKLVDELMAVQAGAYAAAAVRRLVGDAAEGVPAGTMDDLVDNALQIATDRSAGLLTEDQARNLFASLERLIGASRTRARAT